MSSATDEERVSATADQTQADAAQQTAAAGGNGGEAGDNGASGTTAPATLEQALAALADTQKQLAAVQGKLHKTNQESAARRKELQERAEAERAQLSEQERAKADAQKAQERAQALEARLREQAVHMAIVQAAGKLRFVDVSDAVRMIDLDALTIDNETLEVSGAEDALRELAKAKPYLLQPAQTQTQQTANQIDAQRRGAGTDSAGKKQEIARRFGLRQQQ